MVEDCRRTGRQPSQLPAALWSRVLPHYLSASARWPHDSRCAYPGQVYIPRHFAVTALAEITAFVDTAQTADLVTFDGTRPVATLLPVIWERPADGPQETAGEP
ncbi:MAG: FMN-binding negative transcriptional regulator, partial [Streptosporangiaceae bacterium]